MSTLARATPPSLLGELADDFRTARCSKVMRPVEVEDSIGRLVKLAERSSQPEAVRLQARARAAELQRLRGDREGSRAAFGPYLVQRRSQLVLDTEALTAAGSDDYSLFARGCLAAQAAATLYKLYGYRAAVDAAQHADRLLSDPKSRPTLDERDKLIAHCANLGWLARAQFRLNFRSEASRQLQRAVDGVLAAGLGDPGLRLVLAHLYEFSAYCHWISGDASTGRQQIYEALWLYGPPVDAPIPAGFAYQVASRIEGTAGATGRVKALHFLEESKRLLAPYEHPLRLRALVQRAHTLCKADRLGEAENELDCLEDDLANESIDSGERRYVQGDALLCRLWIAERRARASGLREAWESCRDLAVNLETRDVPERLVVEATLHRGIALSRLGMREALDVLASACDLAETQGRFKIQLAALLAMAEDRLAQRMKPEARSLLQRAQTLLDGIESQFLEDWFGRVRSDLAGARFITVRIREDASITEAQEAAERRVVKHALTHPGVKSIKALAEKLSVSRQTVYNHLDRLGLREEAARRFGRPRHHE